MAKDDIKLSPKHGLNPSMGVCPICGMENNELLLFGQYNESDEEAPRYVTSNPCDKCIEHMKIGIILIEVDPKLTTDPNNPYRTGRIALVKEEAIKRGVVDGKLSQQLIETRFGYITKGMIQFPEDVQ